MRVVMGGANCHLHQLIIHGKEYGRGFSLESSERISKILASLELQSGNARVEWGILILSIQHVPKLPYERRHRILLPSLEQTLKELEARRLEGVAWTFASEKLILNGPGEFARLDWRDRTAAAQRIRQVSTALQKAEQAEMGHHPDGASAR